MGERRTIDDDERVPDHDLTDLELMERYYPHGAPIIIRVGFEHGYGRALVELNRKVYFNESLHFSAQIMEAIQGIVLSRCENKYCLVMHMRGLIASGFHLGRHRASGRYAKASGSDRRPRKVGGHASEHQGLV